MKTCIIEGCNIKSHAKGMCSTCYSRFIRHGHCNKTSDYAKGENRVKNELYNTYRKIKQRCYNKNNTNYKYYGGRGIVICNERLGEGGFRNFCKDMGERPEGYTLDRIDVNGNYCKENCRRSNIHTQAANRRGGNKFTGVSFWKSSNKYIASIKIKGKRYFLGAFKKEIDAYEARKNAETQMLGYTI